MQGTLRAYLFKDGLDWVKLTTRSLVTKHYRSNDYLVRGEDNKLCVPYRIDYDHDEKSLEVLNAKENDVQKNLDYLLRIASDRDHLLEYVDYMKDREDKDENAIEEAQIVIDGYGKFLTRSFQHYKYKKLFREDGKFCRITAQLIWNDFHFDLRDKIKKLTKKKTSCWAGCYEPKLNFNSNDQLVDIS